MRAMGVGRVRSGWLVWLPVAVAVAGCGGASSGGTGGGGGPQPTLTLILTPSAETLYPGYNGSVTVTAQETGTTATPQVTLGPLPTGVTTTATFPLNVPAAGVQIPLKADANTATGKYQVTVTGTAGSAATSLVLPLTVQSGTPTPPMFAVPFWFELQLVQGGTIQAKYQLLQGTDVTLSVDGLPNGVTASFSPAMVEQGNPFTMTLTATASAALTQNAAVVVTGTSADDGQKATLHQLLEVTAKGSAGWTNQTSYVPTRATPFSAVYDAAHQTIYAANQVWNRIDLISDKTRAQVGSISIREPRGMDLSPDGTKVWVATGSQVVYSIDTGTKKATRYMLPRFDAANATGGESWEGMNLYALADGTVLIQGVQYAGSGVEYVGIWNPATNALTTVAAPQNASADLASWGAIARSGDGKKIFSLGTDEMEMSFTYDVMGKTFSAPISLSDFGYAAQAQANYDGSRVAVATMGTNGFAMYDGSLTFLGPLPGDGGAGSSPIGNLLFGGFVFSADGTTLYEETGATVVPMIIAIDAGTLRPTRLSSAMPVIPVGVEMSYGYDMPAPFAVDSTGMVLGVQYHGIAFDDATVAQQFSASQPGSPGYLQHSDVYSGPLTGGTVQGGFGNSFNVTPDVYYGGTKGTANVDQANTLTITSPAASKAGPVDVKILFPDGNEVYNPQFFTYGVQAQDAQISGAGPNGGVAAALDAFGLTLDPSQTTVTVGGRGATVTSKQTQYPPVTGEQTAMSLSYTAPGGAPGWQDIMVTTPNGSSTLAKSFFYAKSVDDYATPAAASYVLFDEKRQKVYLSAGDHIDVFDAASKSFGTAIVPATVGGNKQFEGLALTPDGKLLAANLSDKSLAVIDPDAVTSYAVAVTTDGVGPAWSCPTGPLMVAADNLGNAYVATGGVGGTNCAPGGPASVVNLAARTSAPFDVWPCTNYFGVAYLAAPADGSEIVMGGDESAGKFAIYDPAQKACVPVAAPAQQTGAAVSADGNTIAVLRAFMDRAGEVVGRQGYPTALYPAAADSAFYNYSPYAEGALQRPLLNDAGSLYFWAYPDHIDIVDVQHGMSVLRFGLAETVTNAVSPMAIDGDGQHIYLITDHGLTVVDLGSAPLSVGTLSQTQAAVGAQITLRGSGFQSGMTATLGGAAAMVTVKDAQTATLTVPAVTAGIQDLVLKDPDGTSYLLQNAVLVN